MPDTEMSPEEITEMFGGEVAPIKVDHDEIEVILALQDIRGQLLAFVETENSSNPQPLLLLAKRLNITPLTVSRFLNGGGDMKISTMVLYARALGCTWNFTLKAA